MVRLTDDKLIIEINTTAPLEDLFVYKKAMLNVLESINPDMEKLNPNIIEQVQCFIKLIGEFNFSIEQMFAIQQEIDKSKSLSNMFHAPAA